MFTGNLAVVVYTVLMSTTTHRGRPAVTDLEMTTRVLDVLLAARRPLLGDDLRHRVRGQARRIDLAVAKLAAAGLVRRRPDGFVLNPHRVREFLEAGDG